MSHTNKIESFSDFLSSIRTAKPELYSKKKNYKVMNEDAFTEMREDPSRTDTAR